MDGPDDYVLEIHRQVDARVGALTSLHADALQCRRGCSGCCLDDLTVFDVEAEYVARALQNSLRGEPVGGLGACAFLSAEGACRIYAVRPYVCRTQGLPLRWREGDEESRDICQLNVGVPLLDLEADSCWTIGPVEERLALVQSTFGQTGKDRVPLRELAERLMEIPA